jgi:D-3-phosphoglycerate dehydrogenase
MKDGVVLINCARGEIVNNDDVIKAVKSGKVARYVVDFPADELLDVQNVICIPHLGGSTPEAEDNCAVMAARQLIDYIENGNIVNSVNYPTCTMPKSTDYRLVILHKNVSNILAQITGTVGALKVNIANMSNKSKGEYAVTILDLENDITDAALKTISAIDGIIKVRVIK